MKKLTKAQKKVIKLLQEGECIVNDEKFFYVSDGYLNHRISWRIWGTLTRELHLIYQSGQQNHFEWILTSIGKTLKL